MEPRPAAPTVFWRPAFAIAVRPGLGLAVTVRAEPAPGLAAVNVVKAPPLA